MSFATDSEWERPYNDSVEREAQQLQAENAALRREAAAFRWLAAGLMKGEILIAAIGEWPCSIVITMLVHDQEWREVAGATLLEACEKAMESEAAR